MGEATAEFEDCFVLNTEDEEGVSAFHANLDVGLKRTTLGSKIFSAMKGAFDGGLEIPTPRRSSTATTPTRSRTTPRPTASASSVATSPSTCGPWRRRSPRSTPPSSPSIAAGMTADNLEDKYLEVHKAIRADPTHKPSTKNKPSAEECAKCKADGGIRYTKDGKEHFINRTRRTLAQRKNRVAQIKAHTLATLGGDSDEEEDEE